MEEQEALFYETIEDTLCELSINRKQKNGITIDGYAEKFSAVLY